jgi:hypothetical protein
MQLRSFPNNSIIDQQILQKKEKLGEYKPGLYANRKYNEDRFKMDLLKQNKEKILTSSIERSIFLGKKRGKKIKVLESLTLEIPNKIIKKNQISKAALNGIFKILSFIYYKYLFKI